jgi:hypothetical protein
MPADRASIVKNAIHEVYDRGAGLSRFFSRQDQTARRYPPQDQCRSLRRDSVQAAKSGT